MKRLIAILTLLIFTLPGMWLLPGGAWGQNAPTYSRPTKAEFDALNAAASTVHSAAAAPTVDDDSADGYVAGRTIWFDTSAVQLYDLLDSTEGAAVWRMRGSNGAAVWLEEPDTGVVTAYPAAADTDAARGDAAEAAVAAAAAGDLIRVTGDIEVTSTLAKNGVNWWFAPGTTATATGAAALWADGGSDMSFTVSGGNHRATDDENNVINITGDATSLLFVVESVESTGIDAAAIYTESTSSVQVHANKFIRATSYDGIWMNGPSTVEVYTPLLYGGDNPIEGTIAGGTVIVHADRIDGGAIALESLDARIIAQHIAVSMAGGTADSTILCPRITGRVYQYPGRIIGASIDSSAVASNPCITPPGSGAVTLENCTLTTHSGETYSVASSGAVTVIGELHADKAIHGSVTVTGGMVTVAGALTQIGATLPGATGLALLGAANAAAARSTLELGTIATQAADSVSITGGSVTGITDLAIADGGTGASTAAGARSSLDVTPFYPFGPIIYSGPLAASTTYYMGDYLAGNGNTNEAYARAYLPSAGRVMSVSLLVHNLSTTASEELATIYLRKNNTTDYEITAALDFDDAAVAYRAVIDVSSQNIDLLASDFFNLKIVTPAWSVAPAAARVTAHLLIRPADEE
ncbi:MAG: hypothetical protein IT445_03050 [Phycisphaeraceae bacterium]|nr:hypothetical protein [Phycisphaeraceae bacterium]